MSQSGSLARCPEILGGAYRGQPLSHWGPKDAISMKFSGRTQSMLEVILNSLYNKNHEK
jgi:hypothetical protein